MRRLVLAASILLLMPAAVSAQAPPSTQAYFGQRQSAPLAQDAEPVNRPARYDGPPLTVESNPTGHKALEPTVALDKAGNAFFTAAYWSPATAENLAEPALLRSSDQGRTWQEIEAPTSNGAKSPLTVDPFVHADPDFGRVFDTNLLLAGTQVSFTDDGGASWSSTLATDIGVNDHQSLVAGVAPDGDPLLAPIDPAFPKLVYYCSNGFARIGCAVSRDGGRTFAAAGGAAYAGGGSDPEDDVGLYGPVCGGVFGHVQTDPAGRLLLPSGRCMQPYLAISEDAGRTWRQVIVDEDIRTGDGHTEIAVDRAGHLHYVWIDPVHYLPWMASSRDHGETWTDPVSLAPPGVHSANHPTVVAGESGRVAVTFMGSTTADEEDPGRPWNQYVAVTLDALAPEPLFLSAIGHRAGDPVFRGPCRKRCGGLYDFGDIQISPVDGAIWATGSDSCTAATGCSAAYEGAVPAEPTPGTADGFVIRQTGGPRLTGPPARVSAQPAEPLPPGPAAQPDRRRPAVRLSYARRTFRLRLSEAATVTLRFERRRRGGWRRAGEITSSAARGVTRLPFTGRVKGRRLRRGRYRVRAFALDAAGNRGRSRAVAFQVR